MKTYSIKDVEIFSIGKWNDENFTRDDLSGMVNTFEATKAGVRPYIKLGHNSEQELAKKEKRQDGLPSLGWIDKMSIKGDKLIADFVDIPKKVYDLIKVGAYKKVSCEMFFNVKINEKRFSHLITAVSLLGADTPAVMNLDDIHGLYFQLEEKPKVLADQAFEFTYNEETQRKDLEMAKTEAEIKLELELDNQKKAFTAEKEKADQLAKDKADSDKELADLKTFKANAEKKAVEDAVALKAEQLKTFTTALIADKLCTPAMKPLVEELLSDKKEFSVKVGEKEFKSKEDILKEALKLCKEAAAVNFTEKTSVDKTFSADKEKVVEDKISKLQKDNPKMTYKQAYSKAIKEQ